MQIRVRLSESASYLLHCNFKLYDFVRRKSEARNFLIIRGLDFKYHLGGERGGNEEKQREGEE